MTYHVDRLRALGVGMGVPRLPRQTKTVLDILMTAKDPENICETEISSLMLRNILLLKTTEDFLTCWNRHRHRLVKEGIISQTKG